MPPVPTKKRNTRKVTATSAERDKDGSAMSSADQGVALAKIIALQHRLFRDASAEIDAFMTEFIKRMQAQSDETLRQIPESDASKLVVETLLNIAAHDVCESEMVAIKQEIMDEDPVKMLDSGSPVTTRGGASKPADRFLDIQTPLGTVRAPQNIHVNPLSVARRPRPMETAFSAQGSPLYFDGSEPSQTQENNPVMQLLRQLDIDDTSKLTPDSRQAVERLKALAERHSSVVQNQQPGTGV